MYNTAIPQLIDPTLQSAGQLRANYEAINSVFSVNHANMVTTSNTTMGMHRVLTMRPQGGDPATSATQIALYNKLVSGNPALFFRPNSSQTSIQLTYPSIKTGINSVGPPVTYFARQYSFIAGPFVFYMGVIASPTDGQVITLSPSTNLRYVGGTISKPSGSFLTNQMMIPTSINSPMSTFTLHIATGAPVAGLSYFYIAIGQ